VAPTVREVSRVGNYHATVSATSDLTQRDVMCRVNNAIVAERQATTMFVLQRERRVVKQSLHSASLPHHPHRIQSEKTKNSVVGATGSKPNKRDS